MRNARVVRVSTGALTGDITTRIVKILEMHAPCIASPTNDNVGWKTALPTTLMVPWQRVHLLVINFVCRMKSHARVVQDSTGVLDIMGILGVKT
jgi:hypothetical protein